MPVKPPTHRPPGYRSDAQRKKDFDATRGTSTERGYNSRWRKARLTYLKKNPLCKHCEKEHRVTPATELDHIIPHKGDSKLFWDTSNWQGLCKQHHSRKTATEDSDFTGWHK